MIQITDKADCCGCTACANICMHHAIKMQADNEGFLYPIVDYNLCIDCGLCDKSCPIIYRDSLMEKEKEIGYYAARQLDRQSLLNSSSGGMFAVLAEYVISKKGVVYGVKYGQNLVVEHSAAETVEDCNYFKGSKYSQSSIDGIYKSVKSNLKNNRLVLFTGTPCQIEGLKCFLRKKYDNLITVDLVCHAVPSPLIFAEYVKLVNKKYNDVLIDLRMRDKEKAGWSHLFSYKYKFRSGRIYVDPISIENWGKIYFSRLVDRPSCHACRFTNYNRPGDLTIADFWDDANNRQDIRSKDGTSLVMLNTLKGKYIFEQVKSKIQFWKISKDEAFQPCLMESTKVNNSREYFWTDYFNKGFEYCYNKYFKKSKKAFIKEKIKRFFK